MKKPFITVDRIQSCLLNCLNSGYVKAEYPGDDGRGSSVKTTDLAPMRMVDMGCFFSNFYSCLLSLKQYQDV